MMYSKALGLAMPQAQPQFFFYIVTDVGISTNNFTTSWIIIEFVQLLLLNWKIDSKP